MRITLYPFVLLLLLLACSSDEKDEKPAEVDLGTMKLSISGVSNDLEIYFAGVSTGSERDHEGKDCLIYYLGVAGKDEFSEVNFNVRVWEWNNPTDKGVRVGDYPLGWLGEEGENQECTETNCEGGFLDFTFNDKEFNVNFNDVGDSYARVTKCDVEKKLVSGEFSFVMITDDRKESQKLVGSFTDVPYTLAD